MLGVRRVATKIVYVEDEPLGNLLTQLPVWNASVWSRMRPTVMDNQVHTQKFRVRFFSV